MSTRSLSLIEQKRLQWSQEREEMSKFYGLWAPTAYPSNRRKISGSYLSQLRLNKLHEAFDLDECYNSNGHLPSIQKSILNETTKNSDSKNLTDGNTSGYGSETDTKDQLHEERKKQWRSQSSLCSDTSGSISGQGFGDDITNRLKWGDRGVGVGHLWEPTNNIDARLPEINNRPGTPHWLQRTLSNKNHLRGQGIPNEPEVIIQWEQKRQKALELQEAIKKQLQERERKRKEEKELQLEEERKLEQRLKKQQEIEKIRIDEEHRKQKEKEEKENKKSKAMLEALATAEHQAREAKTKKGRILSDIYSRVDNELNTENSREECQNILNQGNLERSDDNNEHGRSAKDSKIQRSLNTCDAQTSLTTENYFDEFKITIPLVNTQWTQTNSFRSLNKSRKKKLKNSGDRPQWGVNRPNTKYMKQSEKDPFYQRRITYRSHRRRAFELEPSGSSRSFDSTDESKSVSSSPREKDFNINLKLSLRKKFRQSYLKDKVDATALNCDSDNDDEIRNSPDSCRRGKTQYNAQKNDASTNSTEETLKEISSRVEIMQKNHSHVEPEMKDLSTDFKEMTRNLKNSDLHA